MGVAIIVFGLTPYIWAGLLVQIPFFNTEIAVDTVMVSSVLGGLAMFATWGRIVSLFVCGECNRIFHFASSLRSHYGSEHVKGSDEKKN